ncbi:HTTM domain-containing protein [Allorhizocola rhizosphaerae]|uniref:HTTM domain-containing protein n=1 Tax=Allorhizocola rhizosphaerae TaxID=1872709 RepID=UPI000E3CC9D2|nr:HTTM domain-containing protein [Allorhizocola rhizosphaerae]
MPGLEPTGAHTTEANKRRAFDRLSALGTALTEQPVSLYAAAALRIGYGLFYLVFLLTEFSHRDEIWGPGSPWTPSLANQLFEQTGWASILTLSDNRVYFEACYVGAILTSALFMFGWRTRVTSILFAIVVGSFHARAVYMTDGGDNLVILMAIYLVFTACGRRWSLDARRNRLRARPDAASGWVLARQTLTTVLHNCAMFIIAAQICILYGAAGFYKVHGETWGNGTALHYVLNQELFRPWPTLSSFVDSLPLLVAVVCYMTVLLQVAFPFVLFSRIKYPVLAMMLGMHLGIAVLMGLPLFSAAMIIADAVFLPDRFYRFVADTWQQSRTANWLVRRRSQIRWHKVPRQLMRPPRESVETPATQPSDDSAIAGK